MEFGVYTFGDIHRDPVTGETVSAAQRLQDILERVRLADELGLHYFGFGEHHRTEYAISAPATVMAVAAGMTTRIRLGSAVTVLSTEDPVRVYQQFATLDLLSGGRVELGAGRGSFIESFPLFGYELSDYDEIYEEKLDLLLTINAAADGRVSWEGKFRPSLDNALIVPRPTNGTLDIWIATGGNAQSSVRAGLLGLPITYAIIGGQPERFAPLVDLYRQARAHAGHEGPGRVATAGPGFLADDDAQAKETFYPYYRESMTRIARERGFAIPNRASYDAEASFKGALFIGSPEVVAERLVYLQRNLGNDRVELQMDWSGVPQSQVMRSIELLGTKVMPMVNAELGADAASESEGPGTGG
jgi:probable LLM family oxidoreductase